MKLKNKAYLFIGNSDDDFYEADDGDEAHTKWIGKATIQGHLKQTRITGIYADWWIVHIFQQKFDARLSFRRAPGIVAQSISSNIYGKIKIAGAYGA